MFNTHFMAPLANLNAVTARLRNWWREPDLEGLYQFDCAHWGDIGSSPSSGQILHGYGERALGKPAELFFKPDETTPPVLQQTGPLKSWRKMITSLRPYGVRGQVAGVHAYVNSMNGSAGEIAMLARAQNWSGVLSRQMWPGAETDKALAKYVSFKLLGFHSGRLRLVLADPRFDARDAVVLAVVLGGQAFVLNGNGSDITADDRQDGFHPCCSLNAKQFYLHWDQNQGEAPTEAAKRLIDYLDLAA